MRTFVVTVPRADQELAADVLFGLAVAAVEEREGVVPGTAELRTYVGAGDEAIAAAGRRLLPGWCWRVEEVDDAVADTWRAHAAPVRVSDALVVTPAWVPPPAHDDGTVVVSIEPGGAFGLGDHPTTMLTLRALISLRQEMDDPARARVLDVGSGTGVLGIAAARLGVGRVEAIDASLAAVEATNDNVRRNGVADVVVASDRTIAEVGGTFDIVLANILAPVLVELAGDLRRVTAPTGCLVVSGVLAERYEHVLEALAPLRLRSVATLDGWAALQLGR